MALSFECRYAIFNYLNVMLSVAMLNVAMLNVIMLSAVASRKQLNLKLKTWPKYLLSSFGPNPQHFDFAQTL
jgi:hypothetical protein